MTDKNKKPQQPELPQGLNPESDLPPDADVEERFNDFWKKNGTGIFGGIAVGAVIVVGIQFFQYVGANKEQAVRDAFAAAETMEAKAAFVAENEDHPLAGLAQLSVADEQFSNESFADAADSYAVAARSFEDPTLISRALLGQGMSLLLSGDTESGQSILEAVALDASGLLDTRGEAGYNLAVSKWEQGDIESAEVALEIVLGLDSGLWNYRANLLKSRLNPSSIADNAG